MNTSTTFVTTPKLDRSPYWRAFGKALGLEVVLLTTAVAWVVTHPPKTIETFTPLMIESSIPQITEKPPEPVIPNAKTPPTIQTPPRITPVASLHPPQMVSTPVPASEVEPQQDVMEVPLPSAQSSAFSSPQSVPSVALPTQSGVDPATAYNAKLSAAVQAAFEVPATASALNFKGRTRLEFTLRDGVVSQIRVIQSSGLGAVDRAAVKAVQAAAYPPPPSALQGKEGSYQIWVACF